MLTIHPDSDAILPDGFDLDKFIIEQILHWPTVTLPQLMRSRAPRWPAVAVCDGVDCTYVGHHYIVRPDPSQGLQPFVPIHAVGAAWLACEAIHSNGHPWLIRNFTLHIHHLLEQRGEISLWELDQDEASLLLCQAAWLAMHKEPHA